jgi:hypothetical protein
MNVRFFLYLLCCVGSGLCDELITCSEESYKVCICVFCIETSMSWLGQKLGCCATGGEKRRIAAEIGFQMCPLETQIFKLSETGTAKTHALLNHRYQHRTRLTLIRTEAALSATKSLPQPGNKELNHLSQRLTRNLIMTKLQGVLFTFPSYCTKDDDIRSADRKFKEPQWETPKPEGYGHKITIKLRNYIGISNKLPRYGIRAIQRNSNILASYRC